MTGSPRSSSRSMRTWPTTSGRQPRRSRPTCARVGIPTPITPSRSRITRHTMQDITGLSDMRAWARDQRARRKRLAFVPTMGALHEGHLRLVDRAREGADLVVLSVFVNPLQFGPKEDFARYPRDLERDRALAAERGVDCLFAPDRAAMYPAEPVVQVTPGAMGERFEGAVR